MKNLSIAVILLVILALLGLGFYFMKGKSASQSTVQQTTPNTEQSPQGDSKMSSLKDLLAMGKSQTCMYNFTDAQGVSMDGSVNVSGNKVLVDYTGKDASGKNIDGKMIMDGTYMYIWSSGSDQGIKMAIPESANDSTNIVNQNPNQYLDPDQQVDYRCQDWSPDESAFVPPATVKFMDYSAQIEMMQKQVTGMSGDQCSACANLEGEAAAMCKKSLNCE